MSAWPRIFLMAAFLFTANQAFAENKETGKVSPIEADYRPAPGSDEAELWYIWDKIENDLKQSPRLIRDPGLNQYVRDVTCKVTAEYCKRLRIYILDVPYFNASMSPNGVLIVWSGALLRIQNEAELALILGHEFGHYKQRHSLEQWRKLKKSAAFLGTFTIFTAGTGLDMIAGLIGFAEQQKFSRDKEREADQIGFEQLVKNGYDPFVGAQLWDRLLREENAVHYGKQLPVFASHPQSKERRDDMMASATAIANPGKILAADIYRNETAAFQEKWLESEISRRTFNSSIEALKDMLSASDEKNKGLYTFYLGEVFRRRHGDGDKEKALEYYTQAISLTGAPNAAWREYGLSLRDAGKRKEASDALTHYLEVRPEADDRAFIEQYLQELKVSP